MTAPTVVWSHPSCGNTTARPVDLSLGPQADSTEDDSTRCVSSQRTYARFIPSCCTGWRGVLSGSTTGSHQTGSELQRIVIGFDFGEHVFTNHGNKCQTGIVLHSA